jgi:hypothetical protein
MVQIVHWRAFLHPEDAKQIGIEVKLANGEAITVPIGSPSEFVAVLALLQSPNLAFDTTSGRMVAWK